MFEKINKLLKPYNLKFNEAQLDQFKMYYNNLIEYNKKTNLTKITEFNEVLIKHFFDSLSPAFYYNFSNKKIIDIGAGAGFPSIPLKILFPSMEVTLLDSSLKRINFLELICNELKLSKVTIIHGRAEELAKTDQHRAAYDIAIARAVARLSVLSELSLPFVKIDGYFIALKGAKAVEEVIEANKVIKIMGGGIYKNQTLKLPMDNGERTIIFIRKIKTTPFKYPRKPGEPKRKPIN